MKQYVHTTARLYLILREREREEIGDVVSDLDLGVLVSRLRMVSESG